MRTTQNISAKWADWCIHAVRYSANHQHIAGVAAKWDTGQTLGTGDTFTRDQVIDLIERGTTFCTVYQASDGNWRKGAAVRVVVVRGWKYLRTDSNNIEADNLGELPEY